MSNPTYDKLGFCAYCHKEVGTFPYTEFPWKIKWLPNKRTTRFKLSSGSILHVNLCSDCDTNISVYDFGKLFQSILDGWKEELTHCEEMTEEQKVTYVHEYQELRIMEKV